MKTACVILAAGEGKRMKSSLPKVLHKVCGMPMLQGVIDAAKKLNPEKLFVVAGRHLELFRQAVADPEVKFVLQKEPKGTGDALRSVLPELKGFRGVVVVMNGDTPLISAATIRKFLDLHKKNRNDVSVLSFEAEDPSGYGRVVREESGRFAAIVEEKDADNVIRKICEVNSGVYAINHDMLLLLNDIAINSQKGEYYLTDIVSVSLKKGKKVSAIPLGYEAEFMGVNTRAELLRASEALRMEIISGLIEKGVNLIDPASVFIHPHAVIGRDTTIYPNVFIEGNSRIGKGVVIYPHVRISDSSIGDQAVIRDATVIEASMVKSGASVGPFTHIRPGSVVGSNARIGNFVELKKALVGNGAKASHLSYIGDAVIGRDVNIGAGTITCNYDGAKKHQTIIEDRVFVGSDSQLVAPVRIGKGAYIGAGSTITQNVPAGSLAVSRTRQRNITGWAEQKLKKTAKKEGRN